MSVNLTTRDAAILTDIWRYRYLTSAQVARLHFSHQKLAQRRLRVLAARGVVDRFRITEARQAGFNTWWYRLSRPGARVVADQRALTFLPSCRRRECRGP